MNTVVSPAAWSAPVDHLAHVYAQWPIDVVDASGVHLHTRDGRRILDLYGGHAVAALGYSHPKLLAALEGQARSLIFQSNAVPLAVRSRAATKLTAFAALGLNTAFFVSTGAEANENALKLALKITGRRKIVAVMGAATAPDESVDAGRFEDADHDRKAPLAVHLAKHDHLLIVDFADDDPFQFHLHGHGGLAFAATKVSSHFGACGYCKAQLERRSRMPGIVTRKSCKV